MDIGLRLNQGAWCLVAATLTAGNLGIAYAAPGALSSSPLFLTNYPQPNIFFMLDDSGSMDWEVMVQGNSGRFATNQPDGASVASAGSIQQRTTTNSGSGNCSSGGYSGSYIYGVEFGSNNYTDGSDDCYVADDQAWRFRNADFNPLYFDPSMDYTPWRGKNKYGQVYQDIAITNAPDDPYRFNFSSPPGDAETINLTIHNSNWAGGTSRDTSDSDGDGNPDGFWFYTWNDADGDGNFDNGEQTGYQIGYITAAQITAAGWTNPDGTIKSVADLQQDFANWFSYYRKRELVAKRAVSELIYNSQARVGLATLHNNNGVGMPVKDVDNISTPVDATAQTSKDNLLKKLGQVNSDGGTPLRLGLRNVGNYFHSSATTGVSSLFGSSESSPILSAAEGGECQQNFTVLMTDGYWNGGSPGVGNTDQDGTGPYDGASYADGYSNTLADVAMHYYETDLHTGLANKVPTTAGLDDNNAQHMVTFGVAFGVNGTLTANPPNRTDPFVWPQPSADATTTIDDLRHAAWNGRGDFLSARTPQDLIDALTAAISEIGKRTGSAAAVSFNSTSLQTDTKIFQAKFDSGDWNGDLRALELTQAGVGGVAWEAGGVLDARNLATDPREIITYNPTENKGVPFSWPADYTSLSQTDVDSNAVEDLLANAPFSSTTTDPAEIAANQAYGADILAYFRGDHSKEGSGTTDFRSRNGHRLGDIIHSGPIYVGPPNAPYPDQIEGSSAAESYYTFMTVNASRVGRVYVGANDGMLHGFDASSGRETMAYIPSLLFSSQSGEGLHQLAAQGYVHDYFVDLSPTVADYYDTTTSKWKTILIGGLRAGGKGLFALDITAPTGTTEANASDVALWEYTHADLGYTFSEVQVGRLNNGKWAAIFGNGYNSTGDGRAKLFIYYLDGTTPTILDTKAGSIVAGSCADISSDCNGLSTPAIVDLNRDGNIDRVYAGDLHGNLWAWDLTLDSGSWNPRPAFGAVASPLPLFKACESTPCTTTNRQPITSKPAVAYHPTEDNITTKPNLMVFFGTGQYLVNSDNSFAGLQRFYGVWDGGSGFTSGPPLDMDDLKAQTITTTIYDNGGPNHEVVRTLSANTVKYGVGPFSATDNHKGWRIDLPTTSERMVVTPSVVGGLVTFNTMIPPASGMCSQIESGWLMAADLRTGGEPDFTVLDMNGDGVFDANDSVGGHPVMGRSTQGVPTESRYIVNKGNVIRVTTDSSGYVGTTPMQVTPPEGPGRMSWSSIEY
ncbi:pilus assembly protein [Sedimenticola selenatireducens]|uniref:pilus assembly protein n=1 Tax=Sedimenticola selenatireducens TaxID=191960 RepID=UPI00048F1404|nr:PilC/PilY family type IV pilus protein [Sedimenticola selenatireducens]